MVRASGLRGYQSVMRQLGVDPLPLLLRHHILPATLDDDEALLSLRAATQLLEASSVATGCSDLGLRIASNQDIGVLGPLGVVIQNAPTALEAFQYASRYLFIHSPGLALTLNPHSPLIENAVELTMEIRLSGHPLQRQNIDLCLGSCHRINSLLLGEHYKLSLVTLPHTPLAPLSHYRRFFGAPVIVNQEHASLHMDASILRLKLEGGSPVLRQITEDYLSRHFRMPGDSVSARVRLALRRMLCSPQANKTDIAAMLAIHPRTLHRRLQAEGTSFEDIKESLRQELALQYLRETDVPLGQLSDLLGFPEQSAFTRSFRRWFGQAPSAVRKTR